MPFLSSLSSSGSPPPTRGTPAQPSGDVNLKGITPAYAGNTLSASLRHLQGRDHPRLRGEHIFPTSGRTPILGSPPPTRGTQLELCHLAVFVGITLAYAGNTGRYASKKRSIWDHPRLRGEHVVPLCEVSERRGSPPPTRGTR